MGQKMSNGLMKIDNKQVMMEGLKSYDVLSNESARWNKGKNHRCYFIPNSSEVELFRSLSCSACVLEDTFRQVYRDSNRMILLRQRFDVSKKQSLDRRLIDFKRTRGEVHITEVSLEREMAEYLRQLKISYVFLEQAPVIKQYSFKRMNGRLDDATLFHLDECTDGNLVTIKLNDHRQWDRILSLNIRNFREFYVDIKTDNDRIFPSEFATLLKQWDESPFPRILMEKAVLREQFYGLKTEKEKQKWENAMTKLMVEEDNIPKEYVRIYEKLLSYIFDTSPYDDDEFYK